MTIRVNGWFIILARSDMAAAERGDEFDMLILDVFQRRSLANATHPVTVPKYGFSFSRNAKCARATLVVARARLLRSFAAHRVWRIYFGYAI